MTDVANFQHKLVLINVNRTANDPRITPYDAVRYSWKISPSRAEKADYVLAVVKGVIVGAFEGEEWLEDTKENFPEFSPADRPWGCGTAVGRFVAEKHPPIFKGSTWTSVFQANSESPAPQILSAMWAFDGFSSASRAVV
jgi:hypothetical protein